MTKARLDGLYLLLLGSIVFILAGAALEKATSVPMIDFRAVYYPTRCLIQNCDPYKESEVLRIYREQGGQPPIMIPRMRDVTTRFLYLPTVFCFTIPFALLPWGPAHLLWMTLLVVSITFASFLIWNRGANFSPIVSGILIGFFLANSEVLIVLSNTAGIAVSLCVVAVWCLLQERFVPAGIFCLALSMAIKPQDAGLVWLYFLLTSGVYRKRGLQALLVWTALGLPGVLRVWHIAPNWMQEWHTNLASFSAYGGMNDPGPASTGGHGLGMLVNLQAVISVFRDDPRIYNSISYIVCAPLLLVWALVTLRSRSSPTRAWLAIAAIAALSLLPVYHHLYDAKLLLLTVPACAMLWTEGGLIGWLALVVNTAGFVLTGDLPWAIFLGLISRQHLPTTGIFSRLLIAVQVFPAPLTLLVMGIFYLWVYARRCSSNAPPQPLQGLAEDPRT